MTAPPSPPPASLPPAARAALARALARAREAATRPPASAPPDGGVRRVHVAMGDPQAPLETVLGLLAHHGLLSAEGRVRPEVHLVSVGDHFDWGGPADRARAAEDGLALLAWLAGHPEDQVTVLAGNHDLSRVGELAGVSDARFARMQEEADRLYRAPVRDAAAEAAFRQRHPEVPDVEVVARDLSSFRAVQRDWVAHLLRSRRLRLAHAAGPSLLVLHAGVTRDELALLGVPEAAWADARRVAAALDGALDAAVAAWREGEPLALPWLHRPGSAVAEGAGMLYHRTSRLPEDAQVVGMPPPRRRFDPSRLPRGLTQVIGHIRDRKSRSLLFGTDAGARDGVLRTLRVRADGAVEYAHGPPAGEDPRAATLVHVDGNMRELPAAQVELLDLAALRAFRPPPDWTA
jgi:hypothetical protein